MLEKYVIMIRPLELSRHVLLMCALLWVKAGKSKVLLVLTQTVHGLRSLARILVILSFCFSQSLGAPISLEILWYVPSEPTVVFFELMCFFKMVMIIIELPLLIMKNGLYLYCVILILLRPESSGWPMLSAPSVLPTNLRFFSCVRLDSPKTDFQGINLAARSLGAELGKGS